MKFNITAFHFREILLKGYDLNMIFLLKMIHEQFDINPLVKDSVKIATLHQSLIRKGLITETEDKLTTLGTELLVFMGTKEPKKIERKKVDDSKFLEWWSTYRPTDNIFLSDKTNIITDTQILFSGSRGLRVNKDDCRIKFDKILLEGDYSSQDLIRALKYEINIKIQKSIDTNQNKLTYMQNSLTYLNQKTYENFIEISKTAQVNLVKSSYGTDI